MAFVIKRGGTWFAAYDMGGKRQIKTTKIKIGVGKRAEAKSKQEALEFANLMEKTAKGTISFDDSVEILRRLAPNVKKEISVLEYLRDTFVPGGKDKNKANIRRSVNNFLEWLGDRKIKPLSQITHKDIEEYIRHNLIRVSVGTCISYKKHLAAAFNAAIRDDIITKNPCNNVKIQTMAKTIEGVTMITKRQPFTIDDIKTIRAKFPQNWVDMVNFSLYTGGQRLGDIACLKWSDIDFDNNLVKIVTQKTGHILDNPLIAKFKERLLEIKQSNGDDTYILPDMAKKYNKHKGTLSTEFTGLLRSYGIIPPIKKNNTKRKGTHNVSPKSFHSLRHFVVTQLRTSGNVSQDLARSIVGHESELVERVYCTPSNDAKMAAMNTLNNI